LCIIDSQVARYENIKRIVMESADAIESEKHSRAMRLIQQITGVLTGLGVVTVVTAVVTFLIDERNRSLFPVDIKDESVEIFLVGIILALLSSLIIVLAARRQ
jgi:hypothetical protein